MSLQETVPCDQCGGTSGYLLVEENAHRHTTVLCEGCGLVRAVDVSEAFDVDRFLEDEFTGDAGAGTRLDAGAVPPRKVRVQDRRASRLLPIVQEHVPLAGQRVLDLRCRTGALADLVRQAGAHVTAVDFFPPNLALTAGRSSEIVTRLVNVHEFQELSFADDASFDVVTALTVHVIAHLQRPSTFLRNVHRVLAPGGLLLLDEKDIMQTERLMTETIYDTGRAHFFHLTPPTLAAYLERAGFEVVSCAEHPKRRSSSRHILAVARKPESAAEAESIRAAAGTSGVDVRGLLAGLSRSQRRLNRKRTLNKLRRAVRRAARLGSR